MLKNTNFQKKMFIYYSTINIVIILLTTLGVYLYSYKNLETRAKENLLQLTIKTSEQADSFVSTMDNLALQLMSNKTIRDKLASFDAAQAVNHFDTDLEGAREIEDILSSINGPKSTAWRLSIYKPEGDYMGLGNVPTKPESIQKSIQSLPWLKKLSDLKGSKLLIDPQYDPWSDQRDFKLVSLIREIRYDNISYGIAEVQQPYSALEKIMNVSNMQQVSTLLIDQEGDIIYPQLELNTSIRSTMELLHPIIQDNKEGKTTLDKQVIVFKRSELTGWTTIYIQPSHILLYPARFILMMIPLVGLILLLLSLGVIYILSRSISKPLLQLHDSIKQVSLSNWQLNLPEPKTHNEIMLLNRSFNNMMIRLEESMNLLILSRSREAKAHFLALQSQMNPHFLYNMLAVINSAARENDHVKVSEICTQTSNILRYLTSGNNKEVTLHEEFAQMEAYIKLMKHRFERHFNFIMEVDPALYAIHVPKLILQPLVENCFNHAFKGRKPVWEITLMGGIADGFWNIEIIDNGNGFSKNVLDKIEEERKEFDAKLNKSELDNAHEIGGLGLINCYERLKILYENELVFEIVNLPQQGARITIGGPLL
ncbi:HAMP domain-containing protein [Paenibacillus psychroresistens]|uniref:HAMP domain-containing protein n=1 Tax=Paenibacillus psychroresistens TaxID=1778678 RepID=A0A6B8RH99_9BACL|nr:sensor histidine kinase [Paenibacillus psychroresistens]QGQ95104.1 HAMP domain-containing protein [Paenibacillus psychroresistens]